MHSSSTQVAYANTVIRLSLFLWYPVHTMTLARQASSSNERRAHDEPASLCKRGIISQ